jgi:hypothetical protein
MLHTLKSFMLAARAIASLSVIIALSGTATADLALNVDSAANTFSFSNSAGPGTPGNSGSFGQVVFGGFGDNTEFINQSDQFSFTGNGYLNLQIETSNSGPISRIRIGTDNENLTAIAGTGTTFDYSGWSLASQVSLEASDGQVIPLTSGTGFGSLTVNVTSVPEPSTFVLAALGLLGIACCGWRGRRKLVR